MLTLSTVAQIEEGSHFLQVPLKGDIPSGKYEIVVVLNIAPKQKKSRLSFSNHKVAIAHDMTFSREEMYDDNGR
jgi:hypothetical protein